MEYRKFGRTGLRVSEIGSGAEWMGRRTADECRAVLERHADECIGCRSCESRCPFGVKIAERTGNTARLFQK